MPYRKLGYSPVPEGMYIPKEAESLHRTLGADAEPEIRECLKAVGSGRRFLSGITLPDLLTMRSTKVTPGSALQKSLIILTAKVLYHAGYLSEDVPRVAYHDDPQLTAEEAVGHMLTKKLPWYAKENLGGDKATLEVLATHLPIIIRELRYTEKLRGEYYSRLRAKVGDVGYKIAHGQPITQQEKSLILQFGAVTEGAPGHALGFPKGVAAERPVAIPAAETADPLVIEAFSLLGETTESGPGIRFLQMISNQNMEELVWYLGPYARTLPSSIGYAAALGPFMEYRMKETDSLTWTPQDQMTGIRDLFADTGIVSRSRELKTKGTSAEAAQALNYITTQWRLSAPTRICGNAGAICSAEYIDFPQVTLRLVDQANVAKFSWEYYSAWRQRVMTSEAGATASTLYVDLALSAEKSGEAQADFLNIDQFAVADYEESVKAREITASSDRIVERIYYVRSGSTLTAADVDMTDLYSRQGLKAFRPAFAEFLIPPRMWFFRPDDNAVQFVAARLGLNNDQVFRNRLALTISHNAAVLKRVTGHDGRFNTEAVIKAIMNLK